MNFREDILAQGLLENLADYTVFKKRKPSSSIFKNTELKNCHFKLTVALNF